MALVRPSSPRTTLPSARRRARTCRCCRRPEAAAWPVPALPRRRRTSTTTRRVTLGAGVTMTAEDNLLIESRRTRSADATAEFQCSRHWGRDADTEARITIDGVTRTTVGANSRLEASDADLLSPSLR
ncbi:MAG: hypothetical protein MZV64_15760 [Ignavibacteriales bacterium]|nr:hypothetical protein [Ignavibacteriales bacterium]